ncbi:hypothetical protein AN964_24795 [Heyndrickxia shackletonii]|uniref:Uncharacterized protein n=1 Tax=Heyndrickxia shackletonii TaxID=157838 RepID=A0A0Q3T9Y6_9BACI|nr:hypothetical protein AN964_24795 [Heyndrickxia shackletonii]
MKPTKLFYLAVLILPWLTVPFLGKNALKRHLPAAIFICTFTKIIDTFGEKKRWWRFYKGIPPFDSMNFFNLGPYLVMSLWILKMTYGKFVLYIISNAILHLLFNLLGLKLVDWCKIFTLEKLKKPQYFCINCSRALLLYGFQYIYDHNKK